MMLGLNRTHDTLCDNVSTPSRKSKQINEPLRMPVIFDVVFTFAKRIPELDSSVSGTGHDLSVVNTEADR